MNRILAYLSRQIVRLVGLVDIHMISHVRHWVYHRTSTGLTRKVYEHQKFDLGFSTGGMTSLTTGYPELFAPFYQFAREGFFVGKMDRKFKEAMLTYLSYHYDCKYCLGMHSLFADPLCDDDVTSAILNNKIEMIKDEQVKKHLIWIRDVLQFNSKSKVPAPFSLENASEVYGMIVCNQMMGRAGKVFIKNSPINLNSTFLLRTALKMLRPGTLANVPANKRGLMLPLTPLKHDPKPAHSLFEGDEITYKVVRAFDEAIEKHAAPILTDNIRKLCLASIDEWDGMAMPLGNEWMDTYLDRANEDEKSTLNFMIKIALIPERVTQNDIRKLNQKFDEPALFIGLWATHHVGLKLAHLVAERTVFQNDLNHSAG